MAHDGFASPTPAETLLIARRRAGLTQRQQSKKLKLSVTEYSKQERGLVPVKRVTIGRLEPTERCVLQRLRTGYTQKEIGADLGCCRWWVNQMEHGKVDATPLIQYWDQ